MKSKMKIHSKKGLTMLLLLLVGTLTTACGNDQLLSSEVICSREHSFANIVSTGGNDNDEVVIDEEGFYVTDDYVYIRSNQAGIKGTPEDGAESVATVNYGEKMYRSGYNDSGWNRVYYQDKVAYISSNYVTELSLDMQSEFTYSLAALEVVDTERQFYSYEDMCTDLNEIKKAYPKVITLNAIGLTTDERTVFEVIVGNPDADKSILLVGGMEGCEYMTSMLAMKMVEYYAHYYDEGLYQGYHYNELMDNCCIRVVPMLNPDGVSISQYYLDGINNQKVIDNVNAWFERDQTNGGTSLSLDMYLMFFYANAAGTDIGKNFPYGWDAIEGVSAPASADYKGSEAGSENETKNIMWLLDEVKPDVVINLRTTGNKITYDYGLSDEVYKKSYAYADLLSKLFVYTRDDSCFGKSYFGSLEGYAACEKEIPALRICIGAGNAPLSLNEYNSIWSSGRESLAALMAEIINNG